MVNGNYGVLLVIVIYHKNKDEYRLIYWICPLCFITLEEEIIAEIILDYCIEKSIVKNIVLLQNIIIWKLIFI